MTVRFHVDSVKSCLYIDVQYHHYRRLKPHGSSMLLELRVHATQGI
jgi:hypothetical protein